MAIRTLTAAVLVAGALGLGACGADDIDVGALRDDADQALQDVRDGAGNATQEAQQQLDRIQEELKQSDLPDDARRELEQARDQLREAIP